MKRFALRASVALIVGLVLLELSLRWLLFSDMDLAQKLGEPLREPSSFAAHECGSEWYLVRARMAKPELANYPCPTFDPLLGWRSDEVEAETYSHRYEEELGTRRPVLFYGDSFTQCVERAGNCWETLLASSALSSELAMLNYGVGGYGLDQTVMLLEETLPRFLDRDPIVLVGLLVDDDLDRCALRLRSWPKPRFVPSGDGLALESTAGPSAADVLRVQSPGIVSYAFRLLLHEWEAVPNDLRRRALGRTKAEAKVRVVASRLLDRVDALVKEHGVDCRFVLFYGPELARQAENNNWRDAFMRRELEDRGLQYIDGGAALRAEAGASETDRYFYLEGAGHNHLSTEGNAVTFAAIERELTGH